MFHSSYVRLPGAGALAGARCFLTVHDLIPLLHPNLQQPGQAVRFRRIIDSLRPHDWATILRLAGDENDLCQLRKFDPARAFVVPLAASPEQFHPCDDLARIGGSASESTDPVPVCAEPGDIGAAQKYSKF